MSDEKQLKAEMMTRKMNDGSEETYLIFKGEAYEDKVRFIRITLEEFKALYIYVYSLIKKSFEIDKEKLDAKTD